MTSSVAPAPTAYANSGAPMHPVSLRLGSAETFAAARALLTRADFTETFVGKRLGGPHVFGFPRLREGRKTVAGPVEDANAALIRLLLDTEPLDAALTERLCGREGLEALRALGVLESDPEDASRLRSTVLLAPVQGVWLACDLPPDGRRLDPTREPVDFVFPPLSDLTREFLQVIDAAPGQRVLELCAGSGVAAIRAARLGAAEAWATDIGTRSAHYAAFNAALSGLENVTVRVSDAWAALEGETFDRVYAHPPYVPALAHAFDYRDAGTDGEQVTQKIVEGLPAHLREGGRCSITCGITDRRGEPMEARLRRWLGAASDEFDVVVLVRRGWDVMRAYRSIVDDGSFRDAERWLAHFDALGIEQFLLASFELRRTARGRPPVTVRRNASRTANAAAIDWLAQWERFLPPGEPEERLAGLRPRVVPGAMLTIALKADAQRDWHTIGSTVEMDYPAPAVVKAPPLAPTLLEACDGTRDAAALLAALREAELVGDDVSLRDVAQLVTLLLAAGALEVDGCPVPRVGQTASTQTSSVPTQSTSA